VIGPLDRNALEAALRLKELAGGRVLVMTMDSPAASEALREALAWGADEAILISDPAFAGADTLATARTLAAAIRKCGPFDLVFCGAWSYHGNTGQVGPQLAAMLDVAHIPFVADFEFVSGRRLRARSEWEGEYAIVEADLPLLITVNETVNRRDATLMGIMGARGREIIHWDAAALELPADKVGLAGSPSKVTGIAVIPTVRKKGILQGDPERVVGQLLEKLRQEGVL
jgi:electron transfer flavoprotein beta subunit